MMLFHELLKIIRMMNMIEGEKKSFKCDLRKTLAPFWIESHVCQANQRDQRPPKSAKGLFKIALMSQILVIITLPAATLQGVRIMFN